MKSAIRILFVCFCLGILNFSCAHKTYQGFFSKSQQFNTDIDRNLKPINTEITESPIFEANENDQAISIQESPVHRAANAISYKSNQSRVLEAKRFVIDSSDVKKSEKAKNTNTSVAKNKEKSQTAAFIIAFLSWFILSSIVPVHRFYLGGKTNIKNGIWMIVLGVLTFGIVTTVWGLIDLIRIGTGNLKPGNGEYNPKWQK